jgi:magnesium chelatase accessory protein
MTDEGEPLLMFDDLARVPLDWPHRAFSRSIQCGALNWHVQVAGSGPTLLLLHGTGAAAHSWADLIPELAKVATVVVPDLPGHGYTRGASMAALSLPQIAAALEALLEALELSAPVVVAGHSAGAALALRWALDHRQPPQGIIGFSPSLVAPPALYMQFVAPFLVPLATSPWVAGMLASMSTRTRMVERLLDSTQSTISAAQRARYATLFSDAAHVRGAMGFMAAADLPAIMASAHRLASLDIATTFVLGTRDEWVPEHKLREVIGQHFPKATVLRWDGGHILHEERHADATALISAMLRALA